MKLSIQIYVFLSVEVFLDKTLNIDLIGHIPAQPPRIIIESLDGH